MSPRAARWLLFLWVTIIVALLLPLGFGLASAEVIGGQSAINPRRLAILTGHSLAAGAGAVFFSALIAVPVGLAAMRFLPRSRGAVLVALASVPLFIPPNVIAVSAIRLFGPAGFLTTLVTNEPATFPVAEQIAAPPSQIPGSPIYTLWGAAFTHGWAFFPLALLAFCAALSRADSSAEEAAMLHASTCNVVRRVTLPLAFGGLSAGLTLVFLFSITDLAVPEALRSLPVLVSEVYVQFGVYFDTRLAIGAALLLVALAGVVWLIVAGMMKRAGLDAVSVEVSETSTPFRFVNSTGSRLFILIAALLAVLPTVLVVAILLVTATSPDGRLVLLTTVWNTAYKEFALTLILGIITGIGCGGVGLILGSALDGLKRVRVWRFLILAPLIIPGPIFGISVPFLLRRPSGSLPFGLADPLSTLSSGYVPLLVIWVLRYAPIAALLVENALRSLPRESRDIARLEGAGFLPWLVRVAVPLVWPSVATGMVAAFALSLGEVGAAVLLLPPGTTTLGVRLSTLMHWAPEGEVSVLCLLMLVPGLAAYMGAVVLFRLRARRIRALYSEEKRAT